MPDLLGAIPNSDSAAGSLPGSVRSRGASVAFTISECSALQAKWPPSRSDTRRGLNLTDAEGSGAHAPFVGAGIGYEIAGRSEALDLGADKGRKFIIGRGHGDCAAKCRDQLVIYETDPIARIVPGYVIEGEALRLVRGGKLAGRQRIAPRLDGARPA